jgi:hypothetical protein
MPCRLSFWQNRFRKISSRSIRITRCKLRRLLFGQAGFLEGEDLADEYPRSLKKEYDYLLKKKFSLVPIESHLVEILKNAAAKFPYRAAGAVCRAGGAKLITCSRKSTGGERK